MLKFRMIAFFSAIGLVVGGGAVAIAGDVQGDAYSCEELWEMRNKVFKDNGYCFKSPKAIARFGNAGCDYDSEAELPLSKPERRIIKDIRKSEARQGC